MKKINVKRIMLGTFAGLAVSIVLLFAASVVLSFSNVPESAIELFSVIASVLGVFCAGVVSASGTDGRGWLTGGIAGVLYVLFIKLISFFVQDGSGFLRLIITVAAGFFIGAVGGIIGINLRFGKKKKRRTK